VDPVVRAEKGQNDDGGTTAPRQIAMSLASDALKSLSPRIRANDSIECWHVLIATEGLRLGETQEVVIPSDFWINGENCA
jgi:hypothetical protein